MTQLVRSKTFVAVAAVGFLLMPITVLGVIDLTGEYRVDETVAQYSDLCTATVVQTGSSLTFDADCINGNSITATGTVGPGPVYEITLSGTCEIGFAPPLVAGAASFLGVALDSQAFTLFGTCAGSDLDLVAKRCGNGVIEFDEECDDGNRDDGDCCSSSCDAEVGNVCDAGGPVCTLDVCDAAGTCVAGVEFQEAGVNCDTDGDMCGTEELCDGAGSCDHTFQAVVCSTCEACDSVLACIGDPRPDSHDPGPGECQHLDKHRDSVSIRNDDPDDTKDRFSWKWKNGPAMSSADFGMPTTTTDYTLCVFDQEDSRVLGSLEIPAGAGWTSAPGGFQYKSKVPGVGSLKVQLRASAGSPKSKIQVRAKGPDIGYPSAFELGQGLFRGIQVELRADNGKCWTSEALGRDKFKSTPSGVRAKFE